MSIENGPSSGEQLAFEAQVRKIQDDISGHIRRLDPEIEFVEDLWQRQDFVGQPGGGGRTRIFRRGKIFENAGVHFSKVFGKIDPQFAKSFGSQSDQMWACGVSVIIHPLSPRIPTVHCNFRMIKSGDKIWFGGGADLTPYYPHIEDFKFFHQNWKTACAPYNNYAAMKKTCDEYFVNHHRAGEMRGISGIFYDHYFSGDLSVDLQMSCDLSNHFCGGYFPLVEKRQHEKWTADDEDFQLHRRGRYVEFNLLHDRGTHFGLKTQGRTESILSSLPARAKFAYNYAPAVGSVHQEMMAYYFPRDW